MESDTLKVETKGKVRLLTLNRQDVRNALNDEMVEALMQAVFDADHDPEVYVIALTGAGTAFCSGADLRNARDAADQGRPFYGPLHSVRRSVCEVMMDSRKPTLAIVNGPAMAGGFYTPSPARSMHHGGRISSKISYLKNRYYIAIKHDAPAGGSNRWRSRAPPSPPRRPNGWSRPRPRAACRA